MSAKPSANPAVPMKPEDVAYDANFYSNLEGFLEQLDLDRTNQLLRDAFSNELAFLDVPEATEFLDDPVAIDMGSDVVNSPSTEGSRLQVVEQGRPGAKKRD